MWNAEIITIGDELLIGQTIDTNSAWMAQQLNAHGIHLYQITSVSDERAHIIQALKDSAKRAKLVLITGGLGPTKDDITKATLCEYFDTELELKQDILDEIERYFAKYNRTMLESNRGQAMLPKSCEVLPNVRGTASGMWFDKDGVTYVSMPGVPYEMKGLMEEEVLPRVAQRFDLPAIFHKTILTQGIGESFLAERVKLWENSLDERDLKIAYLPSPGMVKVRVSAYGDELETIRKKVLEATDEFKELVPEYVFGEDDETMESIVGKLMTEQGVTLGVAESCTGGTIAQRITSVPGSSAYFMGGMVTYSNASKVDMLDVKGESLNEFGAVSQAVVEEMALGAKKYFNADYGISTSGVAGPGGGTPEKPVGLVWIGIAGPNGVKSAKFIFGKSRERNISRASNMTLDLLRRELIEKTL